MKATFPKELMQNFLVWLQLETTLLTRALPIKIFSYLVMGVPHSVQICLVLFIYQQIVVLCVGGIFLTLRKNN